jgi:16S rRNA (cytosine1402-N4)-methyltransferase
VATTRSLPHQPVLYEEIIHVLHPASPGLYVDATVGAGGHARGVLEASAPEGRLLGMDIDEEALSVARENLASFGSRVTLKRASYRSIVETVRAIGWPQVDGVVLDLGLSSMQLDSPGRGFSFQSDGPLDMRFDSSAGLSAADLVNDAPESELIEILQKYGEERHARKIASMIVAARPIESTAELAEIVQRAYGRRGRIHPATRTFQALRMAVNDELGALEDGLPAALQTLRPGGILAVISFHSLEDRIVKRFMRQRGSVGSQIPQASPGETPASSAALREVTRKPIVPSSGERLRNPRARSAKLRVAEKL